MKTSSSFGAPLRALALTTSIFAALHGVPGGAEAAPPKRTFTQAPGFQRFELGDFEITVLSDGTLPQPVEQLMLNTNPEQLAELLKRAYRTSPLEASVNAFLINTGKKLVLIDTGVGTLMGPGAGGELLRSLKDAGIDPGDIDMVLLTHFHPDHIGGLVRAGKLVFANATLHVEHREAAFWLDPNNAARAPEPLKPRFAEAAAMVGPYRKARRLHEFRGPARITEGVRAVAAHGHTPGHTAFEVESRGEKLLVLGDSAHFAPLQFPVIGIGIVYDVDVGAAAKQRADLFAQVSAQRTLVAFSHLSFPGVGHIRRESSGYAWLPIDYDRRLAPER